MLDRNSKPVMEQRDEQTDCYGSRASQEAIKQLGTNGGGFFNANSAHPFENPTPISNFIETFVIFLIPRGPYLHARQHGWFASSRLGRLCCHGHLFLAGVVVAYSAEAQRQSAAEGN